MNNFSIPPKSGGPARNERRKWLIFFIIVLLIFAASTWYLFDAIIEAPPAAQTTGQPTGQPVGGRTDNQAPPEIPASVNGPVDLAGSGQEQDERKQAFGLDKSLDVVVRSDESIVINDTVVPMAEIQRLLDNYRGQVSEQNINPALEQISAWGVYRVRPGDNLWRIHLDLLREYLSSRGVNLPPGADQPKPSGYSSGVGKILKFAEHMVGVYNVKTKEMSHNLNLLEAGEKMVVFNLSEIFAQLKQIDPSELDGVMYDGRVLIFPGRE